MTRVLNKVCRTAAIMVASFALSAPAFAQTIPPGTELPDSVRNPKTPVAKRADGRPISVTPRSPIKPTRVHAYIDGMVMLATPILPHVARLLPKMGYTPAASAKKIGDMKTYKGYMYRMFPVTRDGPKPAAIKLLVGKNVEPVFIRDQQHRQYIKAFKRK